MENIKKHIEAILFLSGEPMKKEKIAAALKTGKEAVESAIKEMEPEFAGRGIRLIVNNEEISLGTCAESSKICEDFLKEELDKSIGRAGAEVLAIMIYKYALKNDGISRTDIDFVRGVNSAFTLRALSVRGLVEKQINPKDKRSYIYRPTTQLMQFLGINKKEDLPDFENHLKEIEEALKNHELENLKNDNENQNGQNQEPDKNIGGTGAEEQNAGDNPSPVAHSDARPD
jgi:segregation and condensation protein B